MTEELELPEDAVVVSERDRRRKYAQGKEAEYRAVAATFVQPEDCPLITPYTRYSKVDDEVLRHLYAIRKQEPDDPNGFRVGVVPGMNPDLPLRIYQELGSEHIYKMPRFILGDGVGLGKAQPLTSKVMTPAGWRAMEDLQLGDEVTDPDGGVGRVTGVYPRGVLPCYQVHTSDGGQAECCNEHLWTVMTVHDVDRGEARTLTLYEMMDEGFFTPNHGSRRNRFFIPVASPTEFEPGDSVPITPYTLGALIGDGCLRNHAVMISSADDDILDRLRIELPVGMELIRSRPDRADSYDYRFKDGAGSGPNRVMTHLRELDLQGKLSEHKFIPNVYLKTTIENRVHLLHGLMDTDGTCSKDGLAYYATSSKRLANDVAELIRSLGGIASISEPKKKWFTHNGERKQGQDSYNVTVKTSFCPFFLQRKVVLWKPAMMARAIVGVTQIEDVPMQCIAVSTQRSLYITDDWMVTHNTLQAIMAMTRVRNDWAAVGVCNKVIILTTTSTANQWESEIKRFSDLKPWVLKDAYKFQGTKKIISGHAARLRQLSTFLSHPRLNVMICRYSQWLGIRQKLEEGKVADARTLVEDNKELLSKEMLDFKDAVKAIPKEQLTLILDETHKIKTPGASGRNFIASVQSRFGKIIAMTATPIKNRLDEFYSIATAIGITPLLNLNYFIEHVCIKEQKWFKGGAKPKILITGYVPEGVVAFRKAIRPWYWGRTQAQVKEPMPKLATIMHPVDLDKATMKLLLEDIPNGTYVLPPAVKLIAGELTLVERDPSNLMTALSVMSMAANSPALLDPMNLDVFHSAKLSPKEELLLDLLDGDLEGESVIVFTKYRKFIDRLQYLTEHKKYTARPFLRITGAEGPMTRERNRLRFQNEPDEYNLIMINTAGIEGINLQRAAHMICLDIPWSWGDLIQLVGRMVRMASPNAACLLHILYACGTVDEYVLEVQRSKKGLFERILGTSGSAGLLDDGEINLDETMKGLEAEGGDDLFADLMRAHAKDIGLHPYAFGKILAQQEAGMRGNAPVPGMGPKVTEEEWFADW